MWKNSAETRNHHKSDRRRMTCDRYVYVQSENEVLLRVMIFLLYSEGRIIRPEYKIADSSSTLLILCSIIPIFPTFVLPSSSGSEASAWSASRSIPLSISLLSRRSIEAVFCRRPRSPLCENCPRVSEGEIPLRLRIREGKFVDFQKWTTFFIT